MGKRVVTWFYDEVPPDKDRCPARRSERSGIQCEKTQRLEHVEHAGRGAAGQWFFWVAQ